MNKCPNLTNSAWYQVRYKIRQITWYYQGATQVFGCTLMWTHHGCHRFLMTAPSLSIIRHWFFYGFLAPTDTTCGGGMAGHGSTLRGHPGRTPNLFSFRHINRDRARARSPKPRAPSPWRFARRWESSLNGSYEWIRPLNLMQATTEEIRLLWGFSGAKRLPFLISLFYGPMEADELALAQLCRGERTDESRGSVGGIFFYFSTIISPKLRWNVSSLFKYF